jgi:hypothetical protein
MVIYTGIYTVYIYMYILEMIISYKIDPSFFPYNFRIFSEAIIQKINQLILLSKLLLLLLMLELFSKFYVRSDYLA